MHSMEKDSPASLITLPPVTVGASGSTEWDMRGCRTHRIIARTDLRSTVIFISVVVALLGRTLSPSVGSTLAVHVYCAESPGVSGDSVSVPVNSCPEPAVSDIVIFSEPFFHLMSTVNLVSTATLTDTWQVMLRCVPS